LKAIKVLRKLSAVDTNQDVMWRDVKCRDMILASSMPQALESVRAEALAALCNLSCRNENQRLIWGHMPAQDTLLLNVQLGQPVAVRVQALGVLSNLAGNAANADAMVSGAFDTLLQNASAEQPHAVRMEALGAVRNLARHPCRLCLWPSAQQVLLQGLALPEHHTLRTEAAAALRNLAASSPGMAALMQECPHTFELLVLSAAADQPGPVQQHAVMALHNIAAKRKAEKQ